MQLCYPLRLQKLRIAFNSNWDIRAVPLPIMLVTLLTRAFDITLNSFWLVARWRGWLLEDALRAGWMIDGCFAELGDVVIDGRIVW